MQFRFTLPLAVAGSLALVACGGGTATSSTVPADADLTVRAVGSVSWDAQTYRVSAPDGTFVLYAVSDSTSAHNLHVRDADGNDLAKVINLPKKGSNGTIEVELEPGSYRIVCTIPGHQVMNSELIVEG